MKTIVITGSTRGIGFGLAQAFLERGCAVVVSGRSQTAVDKAVAALAAKYGSDRILGQPCDVTVFDQVQALWDAARARFKTVDIWINNAGISHPQVPFWQHPPERVPQVVDTNLIGAMYGSQVAIRGMIAQGSGHLYNMEGFGSDGRMGNNMTLYGSTKYGLRYFTNALIKETQGTAVKVSAISPGMVVTDLWEEQYTDAAGWEQAKRILNILGDHVETVSPYLADKVLANDQAGARIVWLTFPKIMGRFLTARFRKRDIFADQPSPNRS